MSNNAITPTKRSKRNTSPVQSDEQVEPPASSLATLGLHRVGTVPPLQQPIQMLNARGMPARIRKPNRFFYDDDIINDDKPLRMSLSPRKPSQNVAVISPKKTPTKVLRKRKGKAMRYVCSEEKNKVSEISTPTSTTSGAYSANTTPRCSISFTSTGSSILANKMLGLRLRNLLKLPKAHKWVIFEWFYSFVDQPFFFGENDFQTYLTEKFPKLRTRQLTRSEWQTIRSLRGKPRRCSPAFFEKERRELEHKRQIIRYIQTHRSGHLGDLIYVRDLPKKIPLPLPVGTKVTARLRVPQDSIFSGTVDAFDSLTYTYRVTFDCSGVGTHSIPDFEIFSENFHEMLSLESITKDVRPKLMNTYNVTALSGPPLRGMHVVRSALNMNQNKSDPVVGQEVIESPFKTPSVGPEAINGYPTKFLETMVRIKPVMAIKCLNSTNNEAHKNSNESNGGGSVSQLADEIQRRYSSIVISMEMINRDIQNYLYAVQLYSNNLTCHPQAQALLAPSQLLEKCRQTARDAVIQNNNVLSLIKNLTTRLLVSNHGKHARDQSTGWLHRGGQDQSFQPQRGNFPEARAGTLGSHSSLHRPENPISNFAPTTDK